MQIPASGTFGNRAYRWAVSKTGLVCALVFTLAVVFALGLRHRQQVLSAERLVRVLQEGMDADTTAEYRRVVAQGCTLLAAAPERTGVRAMVAYAATILAVEHQDEPMGTLSRRLALEPGPKPDVFFGDGLEGYGLAAHLLRLYGDGDLADALGVVDEVGRLERGHVMAKLEALRLMVAAKQGNPKIAVAAQRVAADVSDEVRALVYLGLWSLAENNTAQAEAYFAKALRRNPKHPQAQLGAAWVALYTPHPDKQALWRAHRAAGDVLRLAPHLLTPPVQATALLVRGLAYEWEGDGARAAQDRADALQLDPGNLLHEIAQQGPLRP